MTDADTRIRTGLSFDDVLLEPQRGRVRSRAEVHIGVRLFGSVRLAVPIVSANTQWCTGARMAVAMAKSGGLGFVHRMQTVEQQARQIAEAKAVDISAGNRDASVDRSGRALVGAATGVTGDHLDRAAAVVAEGADLLLVDVAHGHSDHVIEVVGKLRAGYPGIVLVAGNVATAEGVRDLVAAGADVVKVGVGPGGVCTTRLVAGSGVPQLTAILDCAAEAAALDRAIIADGGVRTSGDLAKAIAAGATAVMVGTLLAGCDESEAVPMSGDGGAYKASRGFATLGMTNTLRMVSGGLPTRAEVASYVPEGVEATFPATGGVAATVHQLAGGLRSGMSYSGAQTIAEFHQHARFVRVTVAGRAENRPHALDRAPAAAPDYRSELMTR